MINELDNDFIKAHINDFILSTLISGEKYGYEIADAIKERTNNKFELKQPTMYAALQRLEKNGFIRSIWKDSDIGGKRHYYFLSEKGVAELDKNRQIWSKSLGLVNEFFGEPNFSSEESAKQNDEIVTAINELKKTLANSTLTENNESLVTDTNDVSFMQNFETEQPLIEKVSEELEQKDNELNLIDNSNSKDSTSLSQEIYNSENGQSTFLDELKDYKTKYSQNLELFTDAMIRLRTGKNYQDDSLKIQDENTISYVSNAETLKNNEINDEISNASELSLFDLLDKNSNVYNEKLDSKNSSEFIKIVDEKPAQKNSDALFLEPSYVIFDERLDDKVFNKQNVVKEDKKQEARVNDAVFISGMNSPITSFNQAEFEKRQLENTFTSNDFNLEINYVSTPLKFDDVAKKALIDEKQFARNILDKKYVITNSTKWANIKIASKFYNVNKLNLISLMLLIPYIGLGFLATYLLAYFTNTVSGYLFTSYYICIALFAVAFIYFAFKLYTCPNKKAEFTVKKKYSILYAFIVSVLSIALILAVFNFNNSVSLAMNSLTYLWLNPCWFMLGITLFMIFKNVLIKNSCKKQ